MPSIPESLAQAVAFHRAGQFPQAEQIYRLVLEDEALRTRYLGLFAAQGIASDRLEIEGWSPMNELFARHGDIDVTLDPFPFAGGVTTCNALWMGVPVVTWPGETSASRHGLSFLSTVGLTETIAGQSISLGQARSHAPRSPGLP